MGLHICCIGLSDRHGRGEWVEIANSGATAVSLTGLEITDYTETQRRPHIYRFPAAQNGGDLPLGPGKSAYVFTGTGRNTRRSDGALFLFWGRDSNVWNDTGDVAYLRRGDGTFVDHMTVGDPKRHPRGH